MEALILDEYKSDDDDLINLPQDDDPLAKMSPVRRKFNNTLEHATGPAATLDSDVLFADATTDELPENEPDLTRLVSDTLARQQLKAKLKEAQERFGALKLDISKVANDNHRGKESCPVLEQLTRSTFEPDQYERAKFVSAFRHIQELVNQTGLDTLGVAIHLPGKPSSPHYAQQMTDTGKTFFDNGQTLDRKGRTYGTKNGEDGAKRFDGPVRTAKRQQPTVAFDVYRDAPFPTLIISAREELDEILAATGPLALHLLAGIGGSTLAQIGETTGAKHAQASGVGTALVRLALTAAMVAIERCKEHAEDTYLQILQRLPDASPVPARRLRRALEDAQFDRLAA